MSTDNYLGGMGVIGFWGNTPAANLLDLWSSHGGKAADGEELNILLLGQCDLRHVLKTMCALDEEDKRKIRIHLVESHPIQYARQLLFLYMAHLPGEELGLQERITEYMEIFGNTLIRPQTRRRIETCAQALIRVLTDDGVREETLPCLHIDALKQRERDEIVEVLKFWEKGAIPCKEMKKLWYCRTCAKSEDVFERFLRDERLRSYLSPRYDARSNIFDWDYQMRMVDKNPECKIINVKEYKDWRGSGLAFSNPESDYSQGNITLISRAGKGGGCGVGVTYKGEMLVGPFLPFGIKPGDNCSKELFQKISPAEYRYKSQDITEHSLENIFQSLMKKWKSNVQLYLLPMDSYKNGWKRGKFVGKFDLLLGSNLMAHQITEEMIKLVKPDGVILIDKTKYLWYFRKENDKAYEDKVREFGVAAKIVELGGTGCEDFLRFVPISCNKALIKENGAEDV